MSADVTAAYASNDSRVFNVPRKLHGAIRCRGRSLPSHLACIIHTAYAVLWKNQIKQGKTNKNLFSLVFVGFLLLSSSPRSGKNKRMNNAGKETVRSPSPPIWEAVRSHSPPLKRTTRSHSPPIKRTTRIHSPPIKGRGRGGVCNFLLTQISQIYTDYQVAKKSDLYG